jgi:hypothetical protein
MDVIVIGKASHKHSDSPQLIYCGTSRTEARAAIEATVGKFERIYEVNPLPFRPYRVPRVVNPATPQEPVKAAVEPKRTRKSL